MVRFLAMLVRLGLVPQRDGWRRATGLILREEPARFVLSAFGLDAEPDMIPARLAQFLRTVPLTRTWMDCRRYIARPRSHQPCDLTRATFAPSGELEAFDTLLDPDHPTALKPAMRSRLDALVRKAYNATRTLADEHRPRELFAWLEAGFGRDAGEPERWYVQRVLRSTFLSFAPLPAGPERFRCPSFRLRRHPGFGLFNIVCRFSAEERLADLWVQVHHAGADGVPVQEMLTRLEGEWGVRRPVLYSTPEEFAPLAVPEPCSPAGAPRTIYHLQDFMDLAPLVAVRKEVNERLAGQIGSEATLGGLLLWALGHQPDLAGGVCLTTVEVPASEGEKRSVNFVGIRPREFIDPADRSGGFVRYAQDFARLVAETRERRSDLYHATAATAAFPVSLHSWLIRWNLGQHGADTPTLGVSLVRDAKVVVTPTADVGFVDGFVALGNMNLPTADGRGVGCISIKGTRDRVEVVAAALRRAVQSCREYV
jgi:hypothetical protein